MMTILWNLSKKQLAWLPGDPARRALLLYVTAWFCIGGVGAVLISLVKGMSVSDMLLAIGNLGGACALGPGLYGGLYWFLNQDH